MKTVYLIHGWSGNPENAWFPWLKEKLEEKGFSVFAPEMPDTDHPKIEAWVSKLKEVIRNPNEETILIGHSIGCQTIMRYLETLEKQVGKVILVAPFFNLNHPEENPDDMEIRKPWLETSINTEKVRNNAKEIVAIFSDDDPIVDLEESQIFKEKLSAKIIIEHNKGHFSDDVFVTELPSVLDQCIS